MLFRSSGRAGGIYQPSLYKADPSRFAQKYVTAGVGINSHDFMHFDFGYAYGWRGEFRDEQTGDASSAERTIVSHNILLTMRFTP